MAKKVIPPIHASIQEKNGSVAWTWYLFFQWIADNAGGADLSNYFTKEETESLLATKANIDDLSDVAFSGDYDDLTNKPEIPAAQVNSDWNATSGVAEILNKPTIPTVNNATLTITQGGTTKGTFTANANSDVTIELDAGGDTSNYHPDLFDYKWADHICNDVRWLRADTFSWQDGGVYEAAYEHLVDDITIPTITVSGYICVRYPDGDVPNALHPYCWQFPDTSTNFTDTETPSVGDTTYLTANAIANSIVDNTGTTLPTPQTETVAGTTITYYLSDDGHKIVLADQETNANAIYTATGVAWYYIVDLNNKRFKLPRAKHEHYGNRQVIGNGITLGLTDGTTNLGLGNLTSTSRVRPLSDMYGVSVGTVTSSGSVGVNNASIGLTTDGTKSGIISTPVEDTDQYKYLYFYVGEFTQTAIENTAGINTELFNEKADLNLANVLANIDFVIERQEATAENNYTWYRKYRSGRVEQGGVVASMPSSKYQDVVFPVTMANINYAPSITASWSNSATGQNEGIQNTTTTGMRVTASYAGVTVWWQVSGMAA